MGAKTGIEWTDRTFNPWWGCQEVSAGCDHCYAKTWAQTRAPGRAVVAANLGGEYADIWGPPKTTRRMPFRNSHWNEPVAWNHEAQRLGRRLRVFCASMADVFEKHPYLDGERWRLWNTIMATPNLDWQLLTKRPQNIMRMVPEPWREQFPAWVWIGTSAENQQMADLRIPHLVKVPARVRFVSLEPQIGPVDFRKWTRPVCKKCNGTGLLGVGRPLDRHACLKEPGVPCHGYQGHPDIHWVIQGGESGPESRPFLTAWINSVLVDCQITGCAFFLKQLGTRSAEAHGLKQSKGDDWTEWPPNIPRVRDFPSTALPRDLVGPALETSDLVWRMDDGVFA